MEKNTSPELPFPEPLEEIMFVPRTPYENEKAIRGIVIKKEWQEQYRIWVLTARDEHGKIHEDILSYQTVGDEPR